MGQPCMIEFEDDTVVELSAEKWNQIIQAGLKECGFTNGQKVRSISNMPDEDKIAQ